jgi:hypothetical protein
MNEGVSKDLFPPTITDELMEFLDQTFPERCAELNETERQIFWRSGQRSVVDFLARIYEEQNDNVRRKH